MARRAIDNRLDFLSSVSLIPGLGGKRVEALHESGIRTLGDLLYHLPFRYIDRSVIVPIAEIGSNEDREICIIGTVTKTRVESGRRSRFRIQIEDESGSTEAVWFEGVAYFRKSVHTGSRLLLTGKVSRFGKLQLVHPQIESLGTSVDKKIQPFLPVYRLTGAMRDVKLLQKGLRKAVSWVLDNLRHYPRVIPSALEEKYGFPSLSESLNQLHRPQNPESLEPYRRRLVYEELYGLALTLRLSKREYSRPGRPLMPGTLLEECISGLPFTLTDHQEKALKTLLADSSSSKRMHRLLQGDVGSGKTVVAFLACLPALNEGFQVAWMAPTEILARQAYATISEWLEKHDFGHALLTGSTKQGRSDILTGIRTGKITFLVGTHALLQPSVSFKRLGMIVIDEQHRFGAQQRLQLQQKDPSSDLLLMSATPIPQTLSKTLYGDLDIVTIRSRPHGRGTVRTHAVPDAKRLDMETFIAEKLQNSDLQAFFIVPRIERSEEEDDELQDIERLAKALARGPLGKFSTATIHGRQPETLRNETMQAFSDGETRILLATTVVEVGIDVPAAGVMVIENAERFGLSQLHQLRGRVGRNGKEAYCFVFPAASIDEYAEKRLKVFCRTVDGFDIAEQDLLLRGPGEVTGYRQSGWSDLRIADILRDADTFRRVLSDLDDVCIG